MRLRINQYASITYSRAEAEDAQEEYSNLIEEGFSLLNAQAPDEESTLGYMILRKQEVIEKPAAEQVA